MTANSCELFAAMYAKRNIKAEFEKLRKSGTNTA